MPVRSLPPFLLLSLVVLMGCQARSPDERPQPGPAKTQTATRPELAKAPTHPQFTPGNREQFQFIRLDAAKQAAGYSRFCLEPKPESCQQPLDYQRYVGKRGYFESLQPSVREGQWAYYEVRLEDGARWFYQAPAGRGKFLGDAPIAPFKQFGNERDVFNEALVPGSPILLEGILVNDGQTRYSLSNGASLSEAHLALVREVAPRWGRQAVAAAEILVHLDILKDGAQRYFISPRGSSLRNEFRLYLALAPELVQPRLRIKYYGVDWLFIEQVTVRADGQHWPLKRLPFRRDHAAGEGWEWVDLQASPALLAMAEKLAQAQQAQLRFQGEKRAVEHRLTSDQQEGLRQILRLQALMAQSRKQ